MELIFIIGWLLFGYLTFVIGYYYINDEVFVSTLFMGLLGALIGPLMLFALLVVIAHREEIWNKVIFKRKKK